MPRKSSGKSPFPFFFELAVEDTRLRQVHLSRELARMDAKAARSIAGNTAVVGGGAVENARKGILAQRSRRRDRP